MKKYNIKAGDKVRVTNPHHRSSIKNKKYKVDRLIREDKFSPFEPGSLTIREWPLSWCTLIPEYVVLEHLMLPDRGIRFFSTNSEWSDEDHGDNVHGMNGELWYKEVALVNTIEEAQQYCSAGCPTATTRELDEYWKEQFSNKKIEVVPEPEYGEVKLYTGKQLNDIVRQIASKHAGGVSLSEESASRQIDECCSPKVAIKETPEFILNFENDDIKYMFVDIVGLKLYK